MHEVSRGRCPSTKAAVSPQQPWRRLISGLILPSQSSRESERCQSRQLSARERRYLGQESEEEEEEGDSSCSEGVCSTCNDVPLRINERLRCIGCTKRRPSFSDTESVLDIVKMPVGTTNPVLKSSFSLTSLRSSTPTDSPEHCVPLRLKTERAYHSLTKKSRQSNQQDKEQWRKSWGSGISQDGKEFWEGFQADYDYLMAQNILDRDLPEVSPENGIPRTPHVWSHSEFMDHFAQLYSWLKGIQDSVYGKEENVTDWKLRAERLEDMQRQRFRLDSFKEKAGKLIERYPGYEGEVAWRTKHITDKWETVEAMMGGCQKCEGEKGSEEKVKHEIRCLRKWLREMDTRLKPLSFQRGWTKGELEEKSKELMVLHRDIESQKKIFSSLFKLCEKEGSRKWLPVAGALTRKYHLQYLRSLEWQYYVESLIGQQNKISSNASNESDGEPVAKIPRFASDNSEGRYETEDDEAPDGVRSDENSSKGDDLRMDTSVERRDAKSPTGQPPPPAMVGAKAETPPGVAATTLGPSSKDANAPFSRAVDGTSRGHPTDGKRENPCGKVNAVGQPEVNRSTERPPNTGSFSWKHLDTDSEQEKAMSEEESKGKKDSKECLDGKDAETTSSEGGWTYESSGRAENPEVGIQNSKPKAAVRLDFREGEEKQVKQFCARNIPSMEPDGRQPFSSMKLVELVDELVRCKPSKPRRGRARKGSKEKVLDSCDASGEYTEDSDGDRKSEENEGSFASCLRYGSADGIFDAKCFRRRQRQSTRHRPSSTSGAFWLRTPRGQSLKPQTSVSESALNQMIEAERMYPTPGRGNRAIGGEDANGSCSRRKRTKTRKQTSKKSDSGSDVLTLSGSDAVSASPPGSRISTIVKSGSFSGVIGRQRGASAFDSFTGTETEEETNKPLAPAFRLGPCAGVVTVNAESDKIQGEEQLSLNWDNYQEKYQSEAYSEEPPDSDTAKKLLEFGEDYWKFLGNQSDCASTKGRPFAGWGRGKIESDSEVDEVRQTLQQSLEQLNLWEFKFNKTVGCVTSPDEVGSDDVVLDEIIGPCKRNVECLTKLLDEVKDEAVLAKEHGHILASDAMTSLLSSLGVQSEHLNAAKMVSVQVQTEYLKESWEELKSTAEAFKAKQLRRELALLKEELLGLAAAAAEASESTVTSREELEAKIAKTQNELSLMKKWKNRLLQANVSVNRFFASTTHTDASLKDEVTELYQLWDQSYCRFSSQLFNLQSLSQTWLDFEDHLSQLQCALRVDTLKVLDFAVSCGNSAPGATLLLQDIAGILSDKEPASKDLSTMAEVPTDGKAPAPVLAALSTEGSLSDSGISDSGSEQELSDREKRLSQLKRLAKRLESILAPGSEALSSMFRRIEEAESELRELKKKCRDLIVRSASTEEIRMMVANTPTLGNLFSEKSLASDAQESEKRPMSPWQAQLPDSADASVTDADEMDDCDGRKPGKKFWLCRLLRYAFPFQLALVALLCIASILEPRCCDSLNNLELSLHPRLRYDSGPPPV